MRVDESHESAGFGGAVARFDESVYVEVRLSGGGGWGATLYTPEGVRATLNGWRRVSGEHPGLYFWTPGVILIRELAPSERIVALVEDLMAEDELELAFVPLEHDPATPPDRRCRRSASPREKGPNIGLFERQNGSYPQYVVDSWG